MKSKIYKLDGKLFRYDFNKCQVEYVCKATPEEIQDEEEWAQKHPGDRLWNIDPDGYMTIDVIGLSPENWKDREARDAYLTGWVQDLDDEASYLMDQFVKFELPLYV